MMRRILSLAVIAALAAAMTTPPTAHAGADGELDAFAEALGDLGSATEDLTGTLDDMAHPDGGATGIFAGRDQSGVSTMRLAGALGEMRTATVRVAATGGPVVDHLARERLTTATVRDTLDAPVRSLARAVHELGVVSAPVSAHLWGRPMGTTAAAPTTGELLAPAIQALAGALETLAPALEALAPVVDPLAPVIGPACGQVPGLAFLALGLAPVLVPVPLPALPTSPPVLAGSVLAPVFLLCAALPTPAPETPAPDDGSATAGPAAPADDTSPPPPSPPVGRPAASDPSALRGDQAGPSSPVAAVASSELAGPDPASSSAAAPVSLRTGLAQLPLLPVDHDGEATSIALLVLLLAAAAGGVTYFARRRASAAPRDWSLPAAATAGVGAVAASAMAWSGAAEQVAPWAQVPYLVSGGMTALVLGVAATSLALARPLARLAGERA
ncbi:MAG: hypothetical protein S0880_26140 [Actinomycetota bacterium]|nr:hypothetical protein [Actinomycetota bacterium]